MLRKIIEIDKVKCNGCGLCVRACHEGAIAMVDGVACLQKEHHCDGLGDCLPVCPVDAIHFTMKEAPAFDKASVLKAMSMQGEQACTQVQTTTWPIKLSLVSCEADCFYREKLLFCADCCGYVNSELVQRLKVDYTTLISCPKLESKQHLEKLIEVFTKHDIKEVVVLRMQVPCCGGLQRTIEEAIASSGKSIACKVITLDIHGNSIN